MKDLTLHKWLIEIIAALLILLFAYVSISKLTNYDGFKIALRQSALLRNYAGFISIVLPVTELIVAILLTANKTKHFAFLCSSILMVCFTGYLIWMMTFSKDLPCTCGGILKRLSWRQHIVLNIFFLGLSLSGWRLSRNKAVIAITRNSRIPE